MPRAWLVAVAVLGAGACGHQSAAGDAALRAHVVEPVASAPSSVPEHGPVSFPNPLLPPPTTSTTAALGTESGERGGRAGLSVVEIGGLSADGEPEAVAPQDEVWTTRPPIDDDRIFLIGDSVLAATGPDYADTASEALRKLGWQMEMDARESRPPSAGPGVIKAHGDEIGDVVVILLGNNYDGDADAFDADVGEMIAALDGVPWIVFLTVQEFRKNRHEVNAVLARWAETGRVTVVDWNAVVSGVDGANGDDGLHLNALGSQLLADFVANTVGPAPSRLEPRPGGAQ